MIFVRDKGRMCNNILQYGHAYAWAREHGRSILSMRFSYKYQYFKLCHEPKHNLLNYLIGKYGAKLGILPTIGFMLKKDEGSRELEQQMLSTKNFMLEGWYVRFYDLFLKYKGEILDMFSFDEKICDQTKAYIIGKSKPDDLRLGIHIRRGDYKTFKGGIYYYSDKVYIDYIKAFAALHPDKHVSVFVCGNDPNLNKAKYTSALPDCTVNFPAGNPAEDLCLLSECDYLIGAPSTFSLVAAMYHDTPLLWMLTSDSNSVKDNEAWNKFNNLFRKII